MLPAKTFKDLLIWQRGMALVELVYSICFCLPPSETYGLASQAKRSAVSIPSNIAEGFRRHSRKEFAYFCNIAAGSSAELETQVLLITTLYPSINTLAILPELDELQKMLAVFIRKLRTPH